MQKSITVRSEPVEGHVVVAQSCSRFDKLSVNGIVFDVTD